MINVKFEVRIRILYDDIDRIAQHIPKSIRNKSIPSRTLPTRDCKTKTSSSHNCDSAIGLHLLQNDECAKIYNDQQFSILAKARTPFHLAALEATYITIHQPVLCRHKEFVYALQISHQSYNHVIVSNVCEICPFWPINVQCTTAI